MATQGKQKPYDPRWLTKIPAADLKRSRGPQVIEFAEALCKITKDSISGSAGSPMIFRPWQKDLTKNLLAVKADGTLRHRTALVGTPRKNGKSSWAAAIALEHLVFGGQGGEIYSCAADRQQAKIILNTVKDMVRLAPELSFLQTYRDTVYNPKNGTSYRALSSEAFSAEGLSPTLVLFDEIHAQPNRELWDTMQLGSGSRREPLLVGVTTAGVKTDSSGKDSLCYGLYQYGQRVASGEIDDPTFFFSWWEAKDPNADFRDPDIWREANPGFDDIVSAADFESVINRTPESEFRTKRLNQWVSVSDTWLPAGSWESCQLDRKVDDGIDIVLSFDGSKNHDATAIVGVTVEEVPHIFVIKVWDKPTDSTPDWQVPIFEVEDEIRAACKRWQVVEIACDPFRWSRTLQILDDEGLPILEFPQNASRMTPATTRFTEAVLNKTLTHDGDPRLARHIGNAVLKQDARGSRVAKESRASSRLIDLATASVMGIERAAWWTARGNGLPMVFDPWNMEEFDA